MAKVTRNGTGTASRAQGGLWSEVPRRQTRPGWNEALACALAAALMMSFAVVAYAATLDLSGNYGNEAGCRYAADGSYDDDSLLLLTPTEVSSFVTGCEFTAVQHVGNGVIAVDVLCSHEGEEEKTTGSMRLEKVEGSDAYAIFDGDGSPWGTVGRC